MVSKNNKANNSFSLVKFSIDADPQIEIIKSANLHVKM